jgi:putative oxidoreductase
MNSKSLTNISMLSARAMLAVVFIMAGFSKIGAGYAGTQAYMESVGLPGLLLPAVIALEILGGIAILIGFQTRIAALLLAGFGGFLVLAAQGPGDWAFNPQLKLLAA